MNLKQFVKKITPPIILDAVKKKPIYGFFGNYKTWEDARKDSSGYDAKVILEKVKNSVMKVKNGEAAGERDSVTFNKIQYSWPLLASLLWIASQNHNKLTVLDFGGSLGSSYFQNKNFLSHVDLKWYIVEQENYVKCGKQYFENDQLKFIYNINEVPKKDVSVFLASSSIQCIEKPYEITKLAIDNGYPFILIDRTPFLPNADRLTIQKVRPGIYNASYPSWFLNEQKFLSMFKGKYELIADFQSIRKEPIDLGDVKSDEKGFIFKKKSS